MQELGVITGTACCRGARSSGFLLRCPVGDLKKKLHQGDSPLQPLLRNSPQTFLPFSSVPALRQ